MSKKMLFCKINYLKKQRVAFALLLFFGFLQQGFSQHQKPTSNEYHVAVKGNDANEGSLLKPFKTIAAASRKAMPGDIITVHAGVYREQVSPLRGGNSEKENIWYRAAAGEKVELKGSEIIKDWQRVNHSNTLWMVKIPTAFFGKFNPYRDTLYGDWLSNGSEFHTGEVYINDKSLTEVSNKKMLDSASRAAHWYCETDDQYTVIWATFFKLNPNEERVEINVRQSVFYPARTGINFIRVTGFIMSQAATPWTPPTAEQIGLLGTHWSKGWTIENNVIKQSKCVGITLGKYGDEWDNQSATVAAYNKTIERALKNSWNKNSVGSHIVRNNIIYDCGQAGIAGSLGAIVSKIEHNDIHDIGEQKLFWGYEKAGIKIHGAVDMEISGNHIYRTEGGIWLDWMAQGTRITKNILHDNRVQDISLEVNHGPILLDNNLFLSPQAAQVRLSQGVAFVHNLMAWKLWETADVDERETPFLKPHDTALAGVYKNPCGDARFYNNLFLGRADLSPYNNASLPAPMEGNVFLSDAKPSQHEKQPILKPSYHSNFEITEKNGEVYLSINLEKRWSQEKKLKFMTSQKLGMALIPKQSFEDSKGHPFDLSADCLGKQRDKNEPCAGPFEISKNGRQEIKIWSGNIH